MLKLLSFFLLLSSAATINAQPIKGACLSGNCVNGTGEYQIGVNVVYRGGFKDGQLFGEGKIIGPNWFMTGQFMGDSAIHFTDWWVTNGKNIPTRKGKLYWKKQDEAYVNANYRTNNFYTFNNTYYLYTVVDTCTTCKEEERAAVEQNNKGSKPGTSPTASNGNTKPTTGTTTPTRTTNPAPYTPATPPQPKPDCSTCKGRGTIPVQEYTCNICSGYARVTCSGCEGRGYYVDYSGKSKGTCGSCSGSGKVRCGNCNAFGKVKVYNGTCTRCRGTGKQ